jgi:hypothetical protein
MNERRAGARARGAVDRVLAWLVTGPLGRGVAFAIDFGGALRTMLARRRARGRA